VIVIIWEGLVCKFLFVATSFHLFASSAFTLAFEIVIYKHCL